MDDKRDVERAILEWVSPDRPTGNGSVAVRLFHITSQAEADELVASGVLEPPSLASEGFIHCSTAEQVVESTARHFPPGARLVLVELDQRRLESDVRWTEVYPGRWFPHVHGPLTAGAVAMASLGMGARYVRRRLRLNPALLLRDAG